MANHLTISKRTVVKAAGLGALASGLLLFAPAGMASADNGLQNLVNFGNHQLQGIVGAGNHALQANVAAGNHALQDNVAAGNHAAQYFVGQGNSFVQFAVQGLLGK
jgi:hypothetical protein